MAAKMFSKLVEMCIDCPNCCNRENLVVDEKWSSPFCVVTNRDLNAEDISEYKIPKWCILRDAPPE